MAKNRNSINRRHPGIGPEVRLMGCVAPTLIVRLVWCPTAFTGVLWTQMIMASVTMLLSQIAALVYRRRARPVQFYSGHVTPASSGRLQTDASWHRAVVSLVPLQLSGIHDIHDHTRLRLRRSISAAWIRQNKAQFLLCISYSPFPNGKNTKTYGKTNYIHT